MLKAPECSIRAACLAAAALFSAHAVAEGFRNPPPGAFSLGRAGGRVAQIDTPDAAYHNPANVVDLPEAAIEVSPTFVYIKTEYRNNATGQRAETADPFKILPNAFATFPIIENKLSAGLAIVTPFGLSNEWDKEGTFGPGGTLRNTTAWYTELMTVNVNPSLSWRINDRLAIGAGVNVFWSELTLRQFFPSLFGFPENSVQARGDGTSVGANAGLTFNITEKQRVAFTYRSPFEVEYEGDIRFSNPNVLPGVSRRSKFTSEIEFPTILSAGYGIELNDAIRLEVDVEWLEFSNFDQLPLGAGANAPFFPGSIPQDWDDTFTVGIGGDYSLDENWTWRAGYQFYKTPVPDHTFSPTIPDSDQHALTSGIGYRTGNHRAEFAYGYIIYEDREIQTSFQPLFNGRYETDVHLFALTYNYQF